MMNDENGAAREYSRREKSYNQRDGKTENTPSSREIIMKSIAFAFGCSLALGVAAWSAPETDSSERIAALKIASTDVEVCPGVWADPTGKRSAAAALQKCLDENQRVALPRGTYLVDEVLSVKRSDTILTTKGLYGSKRTCGDGDGSCAVLKAAPDFDGEAMLRAPQETTGLTLDHVNFDGNRAQRQSKALDMANSGKGRNVMVVNGEGTKVRYCGFYRAVCGTAFGLSLMPTAAKNVVVTRCVFADNGKNVDRGLWSDGLTIGVVEGAEISDNVFRDNSDVSLILGGGANTKIRRNVFRQTRQRAFAAFMLTNWTGPAEEKMHKHADFRGLLFERNVLELKYHTDIAIQIGVVTWTGAPFLPQLRTIGGTIARNEITTHGQGINVAGGGTSEAPVTLRGNTIRLLEPRVPGGFAGNIKKTSALNVQNPGVDSFVAGDTEGATNVNWNMSY